MRNGNLVSIRSADNDMEAELVIVRGGEEIAFAILNQDELRGLAENCLRAAAHLIASRRLPGGDVAAL